VSKQTFEPGSLIFRVKTGQPAVVLDWKETKKEAYGAPGQKRRLYKIFEDGRTFWKHDVEVVAEYRIGGENDPSPAQSEPWVRPGPGHGR
jgi:viroplasmin and RNaseH domain-containing protein